MKLKFSITPHVNSDGEVRIELEQVDVVAMPTSPVPPFALGEKTGDPLQGKYAGVAPDVTTTPRGTMLWV